MSPLFEEYLAAGEQAAARYALAVPRALTTGLGGVRLGRRSGSSLEFQEYREYTPGDDLRHLDWPAYARSDRLIVKLFREEVDPHLDLVIDGSRSMAGGMEEAGGSVKAAATVGLAALLASAAVHAGFSQTAWLAAESCRALGPAGGRPRAWQGLDFDHSGSFSESLERLPPSWRPRGLRILVSDLLWSEPPRGVLSRLAQGAASVAVIQILSADDAAPRPAGFGRLQDAETGETRDLLVDGAAVARYAAALAEHQEAWREACREIGAVMVTLVAERLVGGWPPEELEELVKLEVLELQ